MSIERDGRREDLLGTGSAPVGLDCDDRQGGSAHDVFIKGRTYPSQELVGNEPRVFLVVPISDDDGVFVVPCDIGTRFTGGDDERCGESGNAREGQEGRLTCTKTVGVLALFMALYAKAQVSKAHRDLRNPLT